MKHLQQSAAENVPFLIFCPPPKAEGYRFGVRPGVTNLLGLYLKDYYRFEHETWDVYRTHWGEVLCTRTITLHFLILELLAFVFYCNSMSGRHIELYKEKFKRLLLLNR